MSFPVNQGCPQLVLKNIATDYDMFGSYGTAYAARARLLVIKFFDYIRDNGMDYQIVNNNTIKIVNANDESEVVGFFTFDNNYYKHTDETMNYYTNNKLPDREFLIYTDADLNNDDTTDVIIADNYGFMFLFRLYLDSMSIFRETRNPLRIENEVYFGKMDGNLENDYDREPNPIWKDNSPSSPDFVSAKFGLGANLDGSHAIDMGIPNNDYALGNDIYTICMYVNGSGLLGIGNLTSKDNSYGYVLSIESGDLKVINADGSLNETIATGLSGDIFLALTPSYIHVNSNYVSLNSNITNRGLWYSVGDHFFIGTELNLGNYFNGWVDHIRIYDTVLTNDQIQEIRSYY